MVHSFTGGITPSGILPRTDIGIKRITPTQTVMHSGEENIVADGAHIAEGEMIFGGEHPVYSGISGIVSCTDGMVAVTADGEARVYDGLSPAEKELCEFGGDEIADILTRLSVYDGRSGEYTGDVLTRYGHSERVIINCCENDPYSAAVAAYSLENTGALLGGCSILLYALGAKKAVICCDKRSAKLTQKIRSLIKERDDIALAVMADKYPWNSRTLICSLYGSNSAVDHPVISAEATVATYIAIATGHPQTEKLFSVCFDGRTPPIAVKAPVGTPVKSIISSLGISTDESTVTVQGSMICGVEADLENTYITRGTEQICILKKHRQKPASPCIRCGKCTVVCPMMIDVMRTMLSRRGKTRRANDCIKCGCCDFICPSRLTPSGIFAAHENANEETQDERSDVTV